MNLIPPLVTPILTALINDATMPAALFRSYVRLFAAAWPNAYRRTEALDFESELLPMLGLRRAQARQHLRLLRFAKLIEWSSNGDNAYVVRFLSDFSDYVVDVNYQELLNQDLNQQQQTESADAERTDKMPANESAQSELLQAEQVEGRKQAIYREALDYLRRAGVWSDASRRIAAEVARNEIAGEAELPGLADVLGWIAYCHGEKEHNKIGLPGAVLAANLSAGRCCPPEYLPQRICSRCGVVGEHCECQAGPQGHFPAGFLDNAFRRWFNTGSYSRWGVCLDCLAYPCQCEQAC